MDIAKSGIKIIEEGVVLLTDQNQKNFFEGIIKSLELAEKEIEGDEEKAARFTDAAIKYANQIAFILFRNNAITDSIAAELRELPTPEETAEKVRAFNEARQNRINEVNKLHQAIFEEEKALDVFTGIIAGLSKEEAEKRMKEHEEKIREASKNQ